MSLNQSRDPPVGMYANTLNELRAFTIVEARNYLLEMFLLTVVN
jgi:hypothetical protein